MELAVRTASQSGNGAIIVGVEEEQKTVMRPVGLNTVQLLKVKKVIISHHCVPGSPKWLKTGPKKLEWIFIHS